MRLSSEIHETTATDGGGGALTRFLTNAKDPSKRKVSCGGKIEENLSKIVLI